MSDKDHVGPDLPLITNQDTLHKTAQRLKRPQKLYWTNLNSTKCELKKISMTTLAHPKKIGQKRLSSEILDILISILKPQAKTQVSLPTHLAESFTQKRLSYILNKLIMPSKHFLETWWKKKRVKKFKKFVSEFLNWTNLKNSQLRLKILVPVLKRMRLYREIKTFKNLGKFWISILPHQ